jgi:hypothetical protein
MFAKYEHQAKKGILPNENRFGNSGTGPNLSTALVCSGDLKARGLPLLLRGIG